MYVIHTLNIIKYTFFLVLGNIKFKTAETQKLPDVQRIRKIQSHNEKKNQSTEMKTEMTQLLQLQKMDIKT